MILRILLIKPKHLTPQDKNVYSSNREKKILHDFPVFAMEDYVKKVKILIFFCHGRRESRGPWGRHFSKSSLSIYRRKLSDFLETKVDSSAKFTDDPF